MKKISIIAAVALSATILSSCGSSKQVAQQQTQPSQQKPVEENPIGQDILLPCVDASYDDNEYFRELGTGTTVNMQSARTEALQAAQDMIYQKLGGYVEGLAESYSRTVAGQSEQAKVSRLMEADMNKVVREHVNNSQKTCEKMTYKNGNYVSFIAIQIPVKKLIDDMSDSLSNDEELKIEFNREQFRKYASEKAKEMIEHENAKRSK